MKDPWIVLVLWKTGTLGEGPYTGVRIIAVCDGRKDAEAVFAEKTNGNTIYGGSATILCLPIETVNSKFDALVRVG